MVQYSLMMIRRACALLLPLSLAACVAPPVSAPLPSPPPKPQPAPPVVMPSPATDVDWPDRPVVPGVWSYQNRVALYGSPGQPARVILACDRAQRSVMITVVGVSGAMMTLGATTGARSYPAQSVTTGAMASLAASDPHLDALAYSRGRILIAMSGNPDLVLPSWAEITRVVEDCRGL